MKNELNRLFDKITPIRGDEEIITAVIGKAENMTNENKMRGFKRPALIACAAAATLMVSTLAVGAANNWDYAGLLTSFFAGRAAENAAEWQENFDFEKYGMALDDTIVKENYTLNFHGVAADANTAVFILDVIVNDLEGEVNDDYVDLIGFVNTEPLGMQRYDCSSQSYLIQRNGNVFTMAVSFSVKEEYPDDLVGFEFHFLDYYLSNERGENDESSHRECDINETLVIDMGSFNRSHDITVIKPENGFSVDGQELVLDQIRISPFRLSYDIKAEQDAISLDMYRKISVNTSVILDDGTEVRFVTGTMGYSAEDSLYTSEKDFAYPIKPENVESVIIAGVIYDVSE